MPAQGRKGRVVHASSPISSPFLCVGDRLVPTRARRINAALQQLAEELQERHGVSFLSITSTYGLNSFRLRIVCKKQLQPVALQGWSHKSFAAQKTKFSRCESSPVTGGSGGRARAGLASSPNASREAGSTLNASFALPLQVILTPIPWPWIS